MEILPARSPGNPYSKDVAIDSEGPMKIVYCQRCPNRFEAPLARARAEYLAHQESAHGVLYPCLHSFFRWEDEYEAERKARAIWLEMKEVPA